MTRFKNFEASSRQRETPDNQKKKNLSAITSNAREPSLRIAVKTHARARGPPAERLSLRIRMPRETYGGAERRRAERLSARGRAGWRQTARDLAERLSARVREG